MRFSLNYVCNIAMLTNYGNSVSKSQKNAFTNSTQNILEFVKIRTKTAIII